MLGAYLCMQVMHVVPSFWIGILVGPLLVVLIGLAIERWLLRRVYGRDISFQLLLTFCILLVLDDAVRLIWGPAYHVVDAPAILAGVFPLFDHSYPIYRLFLVIIGPIIGGALWAFFRYSRWGKVIRAAAMDREMAEGVGIRVPFLFSAVFALGAWLAALGGALAAPHQSVAPAMGERIIIESFIVVVCGGLGSFPGAFVGALILGLLESFGTVFAGRTQMALPYILLAVVLLIRPRVSLEGRGDMPQRSLSWMLLRVCSALTVMVILPFVLPVYWTIILTEILIMGLFALSFNLLFGYSGLLSFGQAGFFGVGAYTAALLILKGYQSLFLILVAGVLVSVVAALVIGFLCVRRDEIFFAMITLGFGMMLYTVAHNWIGLTGGSDGLPLGLLPPLNLLFMEFSLFSPQVMYFFVLFVMSLGTLFVRRIVRSPFGLILTAVRENKERLSFVGGDVRKVRLVAFAMAGGMAGLAGGLFCLFNSMATPDFMHWGFSARPVLMTILGGSGVFLGPVFGAAVFFILEQVITNYTDNWMIFLGGFLIPVVVFFPKGILGTILHWTKKRAGAKK